MGIYCYSDLSFKTGFQAFTIVQFTFSRLSMFKEIKGLEHLGGWTVDVGFFGIHVHIVL